MNKLELFPDVYFCHTVISKTIVPGAVIDIGGVGRLKAFTTTDNQAIKDANIEQGIDGCSLPFENKSFNNAVSVNTLEHVDDHFKFIDEAIRVSSKKVAMCFPFDGRANEVENIKKEIGHDHSIKRMPNVDVLEKHYESFAPVFTFANPWWMHLSFIAGIHRLPNAYINKNFFIDKWIPCERKDAITVFMEITL